MKIDANEQVADVSLKAAVCIVGAGAAGIALALELIDAGIETVLLEAGGAKYEKTSQALYLGSVADERLHSPPDRYRQRRFGGSTTIWGGRCMPLDPIDLEVRDWVPYSGWPVAYGNLLPYYPKANALCEAGDFDYDAHSAFPPGTPQIIDGFKSDEFSTHLLERFSCPTDFGARYGDRLASAPKLTLVLHANVMQLHLDAAGNRIERVTARTLRGKSIHVDAGQVVLAAGGLEVVRLLLANRERHPQGLGNRYDQVGRFYMCHLAGSIGTLKLHDDVAVDHGYQRIGGVYCRRRFALSATAQRQHKVGNFIARLHHPRITDPAHRTGILSFLYLAKAFIPYEYGKRLHGEEQASMQTWMRHLGNVLGDMPGTAAFLLHWFRDRTLAKRKFPTIIVKPRANLYNLDFHAEQLPNRDSRITLSDERDALGMPRLHVDWRYLPEDVRTVETSMALLAQSFERSGVGRFDYDPATLEAEMIRYGAYGGHHIGTTRMGADPRSSVVNGDLRLHDVDNLYIASAATFPTSSQANPTLTIIAMALRLAEHLKGQEASRIS